MGLFTTVLVLPYTLMIFRPVNGYMYQQFGAVISSWQPAVLAI